MNLLIDKPAAEKVNRGLRRPLRASHLWFDCAQDGSRIVHRGVAFEKEIQGFFLALLVRMTAVERRFADLWKENTGIPGFAQDGLRHFRE
jgi:hypothetical protein